MNEKLRKKELTEEQKKIMEDEGYQLIEIYSDEKPKRTVRRMIYKHLRCGKISDVRIDHFFRDGQRCTCLRKLGTAEIKTTSDYQNKIDSIFGIGEYTAISEYLGRKKPIDIMHKCGHKYSIKRAEYLFDEKGNGGKCPICTRTLYNKEKLNRKFSELNLNISCISEPKSGKVLIENNECKHQYEVNYLSVLYNQKAPCPICRTKFKKDLDIDYVKNEIHNLDNDYTVLSDKYEGTHSLLRIKHAICNKDYFVSRTNFLSGKRCPFCSFLNGESKEEKELKEFIESLGFKTEKYELKDEKGNYKELDIYIPEKKIGFEYDGLYWHSYSKRKNQNYHIDKTNFFNEKGIRVVHIFSNEWENKKDIVKDKIKSILGVQKDKIYARNCIVKQINSKLRNNFLNTNHIQGADGAAISYGLFYNNELVAVMSISKLRLCLGQKNISANKFELSRYAGKLGYTIIGGFSKLLKNILKQHSEIKELITYGDLCWTSKENNVYLKNGFTVDHISDPSYFYTKDYKHTENRFKYRKDNLKNIFPDLYDKKKSEWEIMQSAGYDKIYNCGNIVFIMKNS